MKIKSGEFITVIGRTQTGKTFFVKNRLLRLQNAIQIVFDTKRKVTDGWQNWAEISVSYIPDLAKAITDGKRRIHFLTQVYSDDIINLNVICKLMLDIAQTQNIHQILYIDELADISNSYHIPPNLALMYTKGAGLNITIIASCQRPVQILHPLIRSQTFHFIIFKINVTDIDTNVIPFIDKVAVLGDYECIYTDGVRFVILDKFGKVKK